MTRRWNALAAGLGALLALAVSACARITGYTVRNQVTAKVRQFDALSKALDEAVAAGGNDVRVQNIAFAVDDPERARAEARDKAVADARARVDQLAKASGAKVGKVR